MLTLSLHPETMIFSSTPNWTLRQIHLAKFHNKVESIDMVNDLGLSEKGKICTAKYSIELPFSLQAILSRHQRGYISKLDDIKVSKKFTMY